VIAGIAITVVVALLAIHQTIARDRASRIIRLQTDTIMNQGEAIRIQRDLIEALHRERHLIALHHDRHLRQVRRDASARRSPEAG